jgi:predicted dithiol-disulfide oxidoreductase (DUF899 family)
MFEKATIPMLEETLRIRKEIQAKQEELIQLRKAFPPQQVDDYVLKDWNGRDVRLSDIFDGKSDLIVIHNMGKACPYCTLWADGFNGLGHHLSNRAAFVVVSPDAPEVQKQFAEGRGWKFRMLSGHEGDFIKDMGFIDKEDGSYWPGVSTFRLLSNGTIERVGADIFGPGDPYNSLWHLFDLLDGGAKGWHPKFTYDK